MRSWVFSAWVTAPFPRSGLGLGEDRGLWPGRQPDRQPPGGDVIDWSVPRVGGGDAVADQALVQGQVRERPVLG